MLWIAMHEKIFKEHIIMSNTNTASPRRHDEAWVRRIWSFIGGGLTAVVFIVLGILLYTSGDSNNTTLLISNIVLAVLGYALVSCLILNNNFIWAMIATVSTWGCIKLPMLIIELDLDGILWFIAVKLICFILSAILSILLFILAITLGLTLSIFVLPYALYQNIVHGKVESDCDVDFD